MNPLRTLGVASVSASILSGSALFAQTVPITIHTDRPGHAISPRLWGIFFEEINHAGEGGLYSELLCNRSFEEPPTDGAAVPGWSLRSADPKNTMELVSDQGPHATAPHVVKISVAGGSASVVNAGHFGVPIRKGASYAIRVDARSGTATPAEVSVAFESPDGKSIVSRTTPLPTSKWAMITADLTSPVDMEQARFSLTIKGPAEVWIDLVSVTPTQTWKQHAGGLRDDLGGLVGGLKPSFARFPGGCYVEGGDFLKDAFRWPNTVGDIAVRPGHSNANWGYWSTDGLGYHEYLQLCEDLHAEPLFVVNCGMSHKELVPMDKLDPWIDEALNAIEYANGNMKTKWGAERAKNGHPGPFNLRFIEIGNENGMFGSFGGTREEYTKRYKRFYDAIKAKHPEIITISNTPVDALMEMVDDHYYNSPAWFWANVHLYDRANRSGPKIYVGEFAVTQGCGTGNLAAALSEAAFMTGLERNSDIVQMASYAPMFVHAKDRKWNPDMIVFDGLRSYGTPSYWTQAMFAEHRATTVLPVDATEITTEPVAGKGSIGLGTWITQAEYKDVTVTVGDKVVYTSDFTSGLGPWKPGAGDWKVVDGAIRQSAHVEKQFALLDLPALKDASDYTVNLKARKIDGAEGFLVLVRAPDAENYTWVNLGGWGNSQHAVERSIDGQKRLVGAPAAGKVGTNQWHDVTVRAKGTSIACDLDGKQVLDVREKALPTLATVAGRDDATGDIVIKVVNGSDATVSATLDCVGASSLQPEGDEIQLAGPSLNAENSFDAPTRMSAVTSRFPVAGPKFDHAFPARSFTVLRLHTKPGGK